MTELENKKEICNAIQKSISSLVDVCKILENTASIEEQMGDNQITIPDTIKVIKALAHLLIIVVKQENVRV